MAEEAPEERGGLVEAVRLHPALSAILVTCTLLGALLGWLYLPADWALARRLGAGAVSGAGIWLLVAFSRFFYD